MLVCKLWARGSSIALQTATASDSRWTALSYAMANTNSTKVSIYTCIVMYSIYSAIVDAHDSKLQGCSHLMFVVITV
jgi:hypothetical protein